MLLEVLQFSNDTPWKGSKFEIPFFGSASWSVISQALSLSPQSAVQVSRLDKVYSRQISQLKYRKKMCLWFYTLVRIIPANESRCLIL